MEEKREEYCIRGDWGCNKCKLVQNGRDCHNNELRINKNGEYILSKEALGWLQKYLGLSRK